MSRPLSIRGGWSISFSGSNSAGVQQGVNYGNTTVNFYTSDPIRPFSNVPYPRNQYYIDRGEIYLEMKRRLSVCEARVALVGLGGIGKSELAIEYAHRMRKKQPNTYVFWVHASNTAAFETSFLSIAYYLKLDYSKEASREASREEILQRVYCWLGNDQNGPWMLIVDGADDMNVLNMVLTPKSASTNGSVFIPQSSNGKILVTSRSEDVVERIVDRKNILEVGVMREKEALLLLQKKKINVREQKSEAAGLVADLDYIPLAIDQAASYIARRQPQARVEEYRKKLRRESSAVDLLSRDCGNVSRHYSQPRSVLAAWKMSMDYIAKERPSAAILLQYMSCFNCRGIPDFVLHASRPQDKRNSRSSRIVVAKNNKYQLPMSNSRKDSAELKINTRQSTRRHPHEITSNQGTNSKRVEKHPQGTVHSRSPLRTERDKFDEDIRTLRNFSFITTNIDGSMFHMHPLVQLATRAWMSELGATAKRHRRYLLAMAEQFPINFTRFEDRQTCEKLLPHINFDADPPILTDSLEHWISLFTSLTHYQASVGQQSKALQTARKAYEAEKLLQTSTEIMTNKGATAALASVLFDKGEFQESETLFRETMEWRLEKYGESHIQTLSSMAGLASALERLNRYHEAEDLYNQFFRFAQDILNAKDELLITTIQNRDMLLRKVRRQSVSHYEACLRETIRAHGEISILAFRGGIRLGRVLREGGYIERAMRVLEGVLQRAIHSLDDRDHSITPACRYELGITYHELGSYEISESMLRQALRIYEEHQGKESFNAKNTRNELIEVLRSQGKWSPLRNGVDV